MLEAALKLSDSRLLLVGAIAIDTVGMGTLAVVLTTPEAAKLSTLLLIALAATTPVLALTVGISAAIIPKGLGAEERARRAVLAGTVVHMGVQANSLLPMLSNCCGPTTYRAYVLQTTVHATAAVTLLTIAALGIAAWRKWRPPPAAGSTRAPDSEL